MVTVELRAGWFWKFKFWATLPTIFPNPRQDSSAGRLWKIYAISIKGTRTMSFKKRICWREKKLHPTAWFASSYCFSPGRGGFSCSNPETVQSSLGNGANHKIVEPSLMSVLFYSFLERSSESEPSHGRVNDAEFMVLCLFFWGLAYSTGFFFLNICFIFLILF